LAHNTLPREQPVERRKQFLNRQLKVLSRMEQKQELLRQLEALTGTQASSGTQASLGTQLTRDQEDLLILRAKKNYKRLEASRAKQSLADWINAD
jgi:hypothetical protein